MSCGSQPAEALHRAWQATLGTQRGTPPAEVLGVMQHVYEVWALDLEWNNVTTLSRTVNNVDPGLLNGVTLARVQRSTAVDFHRAYTSGEMESQQMVQWRRPTEGDFAHVSVLPRSCQERPVAAADVDTLVTCFIGSTAWIRDALSSAGILESLGSEESNQMVLRVSAYRRVFENAACVLVRRNGHTICTCEAFRVHGQCEHVLFCSSLPDWPGASRLDLGILPLRRRTGRPPGRRVAGAEGRGA
jgi:hypothetical protein